MVERTLRDRRARLRLTPRLDPTPITRGLVDLLTLVAPRSDQQIDAFEAREPVVKRQRAITALNRTGAMDEPVREVTVAQRNRFGDRFSLFYRDGWQFEQSQNDVFDGRLGDAVDAFQHPDHLDKRDDRHQPGFPFGQPVDQQAFSQTRLNRIVLHKIPNQDVGIDRNHEMDRT